MNFTQDLSQKAHRWHQLIQSDRLEIQPVVALGLEERLIWLDLSGKNARLASITVTDTLGLQEFITQEYSRQQGVGGIGGYMEDRQLYRRRAPQPAPGCRYLAARRNAPVRPPGRHHTQLC
jgi:hypothetical protein